MKPDFKTARTLLRCDQITYCSLPFHLREHDYGYIAYGYGLNEAPLPVVELVKKISIPLIKTVRAH